MLKFCLTSSDIINFSDHHNGIEKSTEEVKEKQNSFPIFFFLKICREKSLKFHITFVSREEEEKNYPKAEFKCSK